MRIACTSIAIAIAATGAAADDWNAGTGGNPARNGQSTEIGPGEPTILWEGGLPGIVSQPAVIEGDIVVMARIANFNIPTGTTIVAHDLNTGDVLWDTKLPDNFDDSWRSRVSAIRDGRVYATRSGNTNAEYMYALDAATGAILWQSDDLVDEGSTESASFAPDGDLIVGNFQSLIRIDAETGDTVWQVPRSCPTSNGCEAAVYADTVYIWQASGNGPIVSAFDLATGAFKYSSAGIGGGFVQQLALFVGPDGTVYAPRVQNNPVTDQFVAFTDTGAGLEIKWSTPDIGYIPFATHAIGPDGSVYTYETNVDAGELTIRRRNPDTGAVIDSSDVLPTSDVAPSPRMAIDAEGKIFLTNGGFPNGALISLDADLTTRWTYPVLNVNIGGPALGSGGTLVVTGVGTNVVAFRDESCQADCNADGELNILDFVCFQQLFQSGDDSADVNGDGELNILDFVAFQQLFQAGCP